MPLTDLRIPALEPGATSRIISAGVYLTGQDRSGFGKVRRKICGNEEHRQIPDAGPSTPLLAKRDGTMARAGAFSLKGAPSTKTIRTLIINGKARPVPGRQKGKGRGGAGFRLCRSAAAPIAAGREASEDGEILSLAVSPDVPGPDRPVRAAFSRNTEDGAGIICQAEGCPEFQEGTSCRRSGGPLLARRRPRQEPERVK